MIRTQVQLEEKQMEALRRSAAQRRVSIAELIRQSIDAYIEPSGTIDDAEKRRRAVAVAGRFHSGLSDVAAQHDRYLVEAYDDRKR